MHKACGHGGVNHVFSELRQRFWVEKGSSTIRKVISDCLQCRKHKAKTLTQKMADLPPARMQTFEPAFTHTGVDYCGPFLVKQVRSRVKRYCCVFTCLTTKAIHLEVATDLTTNCFLNVLRRFVARRRSVKHLYSDNGTNFVGADKVLREELGKCNQERICAHMCKTGIDWSFNPPSASHFGGVWERMVRSVRKVLNALQPNSIYSEDVLVTVLTEVEAVINSRPLTPVSFHNIEEGPLTPNDLLCPDASHNLPTAPSEDRDAYLYDKYKQTKFLINKARERWVKEYLPNIADRNKWFAEQRNLQINDIVILADHPNSKELDLGRVVGVYPDRKGLVRSAKLRIKNGEIIRPIVKMKWFVPAEETVRGKVPTWLSPVNCGEISNAMLETVDDD